MAIISQDIKAQVDQLTAQKMAVYISGLTFALVLLLTGVLINANGNISVIQYRLDSIDNNLIAINKQLAESGQRGIDTDIKINKILKKIGVNDNGQ